MASVDLAFLRCFPAERSWTVTGPARTSKVIGQQQTRRTAMTTTETIPTRGSYDRAIQSSKRVYWDIDRDVIRGRHFDLRNKFLPDGLSRIDGFKTLSPGERRFVSQIQGRTYAKVFGLV